MAWLQISINKKNINQVATIFLYFRFRFKSFRTNPGVPFFSNLQRFGNCFERHLVHRDLQNGASPVEDFSAQWLQYRRGSCGLPGVLHLSVVVGGMGMWDIIIMKNATPPKKDPYKNYDLICIVLAASSTPNEVALWPKCCTLMTPVGNCRDLNVCNKCCRCAMGRRRFFPLLRISTPVYTMPLHRFSLSSGQDHTVFCVLQGSYGSCPWMNSLMWPFHSSTASTKALSKIMGKC